MVVVVQVECMRLELLVHPSRGNSLEAATTYLTEIARYHLPPTINQSPEGLASPAPMIPTSPS